MRGSFLDVSQWDPGVQRGGDECVAQGVRPHRLGDPGPAGGASDDPARAVAVQPPAIRSQEDRAFGALAGGQVDRPGSARRERDGDDLAALPGDHQSAVPALHAQGLDVSAGRFGDPQPVEGEQGDKRMFRRWPESRRDQEGAKLVAVQPYGVGLIVQPRPAHVGGR